MRNRRPVPSIPWLILCVLLLSAAVSWHDLAAHEVLGRDENATIAKLDQPNLLAVVRAVPMKVTGQPGNMQPLYFVLQHTMWPLVGQSAFVLRFLPAAFGILAAAATFKLGQALFSSKAGLVGALLTALLPLHVQYSQIARPYTLLALLSLASAYFLLRAWQTDRPLHWAGFALTGALAFYTHYNALFVLAAEALFVAAVWPFRLADVWRRRISAGRLSGAIAGWLALALLCAPGLVQLAGLPWTGLDGGGEPGAAVAVQLGPAFAARFLDKIGLDSPWLRGTVIAFMALGLLSALIRRRWAPVLLAVIWIVVPFALLAAIKSPRPFVERYVIFIPPVALLLAGEGIVGIGCFLRLALRRMIGTPGLAWVYPTVATTLSLALALLFVSPLRTYYAANRSANRLGQAVAVVERHARAGDAVIISPRFLVRRLAVNGADVVYVPRQVSPGTLDELAGRYERLWLLYSSYLPPAELQEPLDRWYQSEQEWYARVPIKAITALAYRNLALTDPEANLQDRIALLAEIADSDEKQEAYLRHTALADAYQALSDLYTTQGKLILAADYAGRADATRAEAPPPW